MYKASEDEGDQRKDGSMYSGATMLTWAWL